MKGYKLAHQQGKNVKPTSGDPTEKFKRKLDKFLISHSYYVKGEKNNLGLRDHFRGKRRVGYVEIMQL